MITNIIDHRKRKYRWLRVDAVIEPTWHDNSVKDADQAPRRRRESVREAYDDRGAISVVDALTWGMGIAYPVTLYLYDANTIRDEEGKLITRPIKGRRRKAP